MRKSLFFFVTFVFINFSQSLTMADDVTDFEIEGISVGDNLLDHFSLEHIDNFDKEYYPESKKFYEQYIHWPKKSKFKIYDGLTVSLKANSHIVYGISGNLTNFENFKECLSKKDEITKKITKSFQTKIINDNLEKNIFDYADNKSQKSQVQIRLLDNSGLFTVNCTDWSKKAEEKNNWVDNLGVKIYSKKYEYFLRNEAYK